MNGQLSAEAADLKRLCDSVAETVAYTIRELVGDPASGAVIKIGASGTPTKMIDRAAEDSILNTLSLSGIGFKVLSEEIGNTSIGANPKYFLHLDPLDGTFNAIKGIPFYSVSIYLANDNFRFAYISDLASGIKYFAEAGRGAYLESNKTVRLDVSKTSDLKDFSISAYTLRPNTSRIVGVGDKVRRIRTLGSTSLEMSLVAAGKLDAFVDIRGRMRVVDVAAGKLIIEEAGGKVTDASGGDIHLNGDMWQRTDLIGSNGILHGELLTIIGGGAN